MEVMILPLGKDGIHGAAFASKDGATSFSEALRMGTDIHNQSV